jgi:hypothetical protein
MTVIVQSVIAWDLPQTDGRRVVREEHTDDAGVVHVFDYMAETDTDINAKLAARAAELQAD